MTLTQDSKKSIQLQHWEILGHNVTEALKKNNFSAEFITTKEKARTRLLELIPEQGSVGFGGSETIQQLNVLDELVKRGNIVLAHGVPGLTPEEVLNTRKMQLTSDCFICSANVVTANGKLVNMDAVGNRVAAMIFGPKKTILVIGVNKIVKDLDGALERLELWAAPENNTRLGTGNPCVNKGFCQDCQGSRRICNVMTVIHKKPPQSDITVLVVGEALGY